MKSKRLKSSIFLLSIICFFITCKLTYNMGIYVDEFNTSPDVVVGGEFWLAMYWIRLAVLALICVLSGIRLFSKEN